MHVDCVRHIGRCNQSGIESHRKTWEYSLMSKDVDMGVAGSLTMIVLCTAIALLLRSFYKRYTRLVKREDESEN